MSIAETVKAQLGKLEPESISHFNGGEFAYFHPTEIAELVAEVERLTAENEYLDQHNTRLRTECHRMLAGEVRASLCETCEKANVSCPVYPQDTQTCVEYSDARWEMWKRNNPGICGATVNYHVIKQAYTDACQGR